MISDITTGREAPTNAVIKIKIQEVDYIVRFQGLTAASVKKTTS
jgi:hypothetical protein